MPKAIRPPALIRFRSFKDIKKKPGNDLLSHQAPLAVPSAHKGLTSVFGMGTGVSPSLKLPGIWSFLNTRLAADGDTYRIPENLEHVPTGCFALINLMVKPHGLLVLVSSIRHRTYTPSLSNP